MTTQQLHMFNGLYFVALVVVAFLTRATARRIAGALVGGAVFAVVALGIIALGRGGAVVAHDNHLGAVFPGAATLRLRHLGRPGLSRDVADRSAVRLARAWPWCVVFAAAIGPPRD